MKSLELGEDQVQMLINAQELKIKECEAELETAYAIVDFEMRAKWAFQEFIESLGRSKQIECVEFIYNKYGACDFSKDALAYWHDISFDLTDIDCSKAHFKPWTAEEKADLEKQ